MSMILAQNEEQNVTLIDIPRSIEEAQGGEDGGNLVRRLISSRSLDKPYPSVEPKSAKAVSAVPEPAIQDLLLQRHLQIALEELSAIPGLQWALQRTVPVVDDDFSTVGSKRRLSDDEGRGPVERALPVLDMDLDMYSAEVFHNPKSTIESTYSTFGPGTSYIPPLSSFILGNVESSLDTFAAAAPRFDCVIMDPPWPNRSARRKQAYGISSDSTEIKDLLSMIPLKDHLNENALVGVWVTNKAAFRSMLLEEGGLFEKWGVELVEEWVWLKVTTAGEPICALDSTWRKPYESLLVGRRRNTPSTERPEPGRRVIIAVPDLHSRKPNLKALFEPLLPPNYHGLEIFARNLTTGWWAWGNEVLKFQHESQWIVQPKRYSQ